MFPDIMKDKCFKTFTKSEHKRFKAYLSYKEALKKTLSYMIFFFFDHIEKKDQGHIF